MNEKYNSILNIDENNWGIAISFNKGDTVEYMGISKKDKSYFIVKDKNQQKVFVYRSTMKEIDNYFENQRLKMDSERKFILDKNVGTLKKYDTVTILNAVQGSMGYRILKISNGLTEAVTNTDDHKLRQLLDNEINRMIEESNNLVATKLKQENEETIKKLKAKYGEAVYKRIMLQEVWIGMTPEMAVDSRGKPLDINRTVSASGKKEQWVYGLKKYLYFENGKLTSWQD